MSNGKHTHTLRHTAKLTYRYTRTHTHTHTRTNTHTYTHTRTNTHIHTHTHIQTHTDAHKHVPTFVPTYRLVRCEYSYPRDRPILYADKSSTTPHPCRYNGRPRDHRMTDSKLPVAPLMADNQTLKREYSY